MAETLEQIAQKLKSSDKKVQLIYAFNGTGKTRLSREFKELIAPKDEEEETGSKILYYNAFTEDLFYWDNDLEDDQEAKLKIQPNAFTQWVLTEQGQDQNVIANFQHYTNDKLTPHFNEDYSQVTFSFERGNEEADHNIKISKGEESNFIWSIFYSLLEQVISVLNVTDESERETDKFNDLEYVFIDDPVSSLDENHLIELAVQISKLIKHSNSNLKFVLTTHNSLFYNVLYNETGTKAGNILKKFDDGNFEMEEKKGDSNKSFSYHLYLIQTIEFAIRDKKIEKFHFTLLRNLYEKTATFLGYPKWSQLLPSDGQEAYLRRIINFTSHSTLSNDSVAIPTEQEKKTVEFLLNNLKTNYNFWQEAAQNES